MEYRDDSNSWGYFLSPVTAASFVVTLFLSLNLSPRISPLVTSKYHSLGFTKRTFDTLWPSTLNALILSSVALYLLASGRMGTDSFTRIYSKDPLGFAVMQIALGYFLADLIVSFSDKKLSKNKGMIIHHLVAGTAVCFGLHSQGRFMYFVVMFFISEVSTPFLNLLLALHFTGNKNSRWYVFASVGVWTSFFLCRIAIIPWQWYVAMGSVTHPAVHVLVRIELRFMLVAYHVLLHVLNCYWFYLLSVGGLEMLRNLRKTNHSTSYTSYNRLLCQCSKAMQQLS